MAEFRMPSLGADMDEGTVIEWLVKPGDTVRKGDPVAVVDTDKAAIEVETFAAGTIGEILVPVGERVQVGTTLATINGTTPTPPQATPPPAAPASAEPPLAGPPPTPPTRPAPRTSPSRGDRLPPGRRVVESGREMPPESTTRRGPAERVKASPYARKLARELGVELGDVPGTGHRGLVTSQDVRRFAETTPSPDGHTVPTGSAADTTSAPGGRTLPTGSAADTTSAPGGRAVPTGSAADTTSAPGGRAVRAGSAAETTSAPAAAGQVAEGRPARHVVQKSQRAAIARLMARSAREVPHYYLSTTVDLGTAVDWLTRTNRKLPVAERLVPAALVLKATAVAAHRHPELNGYWLEDGFQGAQQVHLGIAISLRGGGLVAPALHDADSLPVSEVMAGLRDLVERARSGRLRRAEMTDATITITNLGEQGVESVHGIIYPPQVALVGAGRIVERPWAVDGLLGVRPCLTLTLAADHRATDGFTGARFLATIDQLLQTPEEL